MTINVAVIYYSATGTVHALAEAVADGAVAAGAEVRLRRVTDLPPADTDGPVATLDDLVWADAFAFGTPTRFGTPAAPLKRFIDDTAGLWREGALADKPATAFTAAFNRHGGNEATILALGNVFYHWGALIVPPGYTDPAVSAAGGNPYGTSFVTGPRGTGPDDAALAAARFQGRRLALITMKLRGDRHSAASARETVGSA
ncbi:NAD(P)H:quinone oxidoreductase [Virgisporangium ochraceum]|uniref:TrpR-binding protein WrbA n=1 Tax=Virgisporangium ochraceum TaxID=65505 RepID=A0A8J3ZWP3_9ACTN|nr:NAD(P)H:quinone oxidoreductase [Virgisporangium ochraceum]GIJ71749.1 TrpR-binding protein WrbA [Virgisporangium ochraceum]